MLLCSAVSWANGVICHALPPMLGYGSLILIIRSSKRGRKVRRNRWKLVVRGRKNEGYSGGNEWYKVRRFPSTVTLDLGLRPGTLQRIQLKCGVHSSWINIFACLFNGLPFFLESRDYLSAGWPVDRPAWWDPLSQQKRLGRGRG